MDIATLLGIFVGIGLVVLAIFLGEGMNGFKPFLNAEAVLIVMGRTFSPALGIIGTFLGRSLMRSSISNVEEVPRRMALCLAAAFFGLGSGYMFFLPMGGKLRRRSEEELLIKEIIIRGVLLLQSGVSPSIMEANLKAYLELSKRALIQKAA